jgi:hypothetical protein
VEVLEAVMAGTVLPVIAAFVFVAVIAGLVVHAHLTRRQDRQYVLVNGVSSGLPRMVCRLNGLGCRDLDPALLRRGARVAR